MKKTTNTNAHNNAEPIVIQEEFLTVEELAALLKITKMTVYRMIKRKVLPYYSIGRVIRFRKPDVEEFLLFCRNDKTSGREAAKE